MTRRPSSGKTGAANAWAGAPERGTKRHSASAVPVSSTRRAFETTTGAGAGVAGEGEHQDDQGRQGGESGEVQRHGPHDTEVCEHKYAWPCHSEELRLGSVIPRSLVWSGDEESAVSAPATAIACLGVDYNLANRETSLGTRCASHPRPASLLRGRPGRARGGGPVVGRPRAHPRHPRHRHRRRHRRHLGAHPGPEVARARRQARGDRLRQHRAAGEAGGARPGAGEEDRHPHRHRDQGERRSRPPGRVGQGLRPREIPGPGDEGRSPGPDRHRHGVARAHDPDRHRPAPEPEGGARARAADRRQAAPGRHVRQHPPGLRRAGRRPSPSGTSRPTRRPRAPCSPHPGGRRS